jgi:hypothetical protein
MYVQMRYLLVRALANGVPQAQALIGECGGNRSGNSRDGCHQCRTGLVIERSNILKVPPLRIPDDRDH